MKMFYFYRYLKALNIFAISALMLVFSLTASATLTDSKTIGDTVASIQFLNHIDFVDFSYAQPIYSYFTINNSAEDQATVQCYLISSKARTDSKKINDHFDYNLYSSSFSLNQKSVNSIRSATGGVNLEGL